MNYSALLAELNNASAFDLYRLQSAIRRELDSPERIMKIKQKLLIGMEIGFFDPVENRTIMAKLVKLGRKTATIAIPKDNVSYSVPYYMLNVDGVDTDIHPANNRDKLTANTLKVGDSVGFNHDGQSISGTVIRLNKKTATIVTSCNHQWRVGYGHLYLIYETEGTTVTHKQQLIRAADE